MGLRQGGKPFIIKWIKSINLAYSLSLHFFIYFTVILFHSLLKFMTTLHDISWAFTVYYLLQFTLNAMGHKRQSSSHLQRGRGKEVLYKTSSCRRVFTCWNIQLWIGPLRLLAAATLPVLRDEWFLQHAPETWFPKSNQQSRNAANAVLQDGTKVQLEHIFRFGGVVSGLLI